MMNKQLAFVKSGLGLALCFLMVGAGVTPPIHASNANVSISQQAKKVTGQRIFLVGKLSFKRIA